MIEAGLTAAAVFIILAIYLTARHRRRQARRDRALALADRHRRHTEQLRQDRAEHRATFPHRTPGTDLGLTYDEDDTDNLRARLEAQRPTKTQRAHDRANNTHDPYLGTTPAVLYGTTNYTPPTSRTDDCPPTTTSTTDTGGSTSYDSGSTGGDCGSGF